MTRFGEQSLSDSIKRVSGPEVDGARPRHKEGRGLGLLDASCQEVELSPRVAP